MRKVAYVAEDYGPRATLEPLAAALPGSWLGEDFASAMREQRIELLVCGTSDTAAGRQVEAAARRAACQLGVPIVVIEDFPGNYPEVPGGGPRLLFVESEFAASLARRTANDGSLPIHVCPSMRYDVLRRQLHELRAKSGSRNAALWIGQPETRDSFVTLERLLPALATRGTSLWFRAHPRDEGYAHGAYRGLLDSAGLLVEDVSSRPLAELFARRPALVVTQFSSVAIEAGFWGICAVNALFADVGARALAAKKGYAVPPWCEQGAAFLILREADVEKVLDTALGSMEARAQVLQCFDRYFSVHEEGGQRLINVLYNHGFL
jgi:hypothetical protein